MDVQLAVDAFNVNSDGIDADGQEVRDFFVGHALCQAVEDLFFAFRKLLDFLVVAAAFVEVLHDLAGDVAGHRGIARMDVPNCLDDIRLGSPFKQITARTRQQRIEDLVAVLVDGEHKHVGGRNHGFEFPDAIDAAHFRQIDIHDHYIRNVAVELVEGRLGSGITAGADETAGLSNLTGQILPNPVIIFNDRYFDSHV